MAKFRLRQASARMPGSVQDTVSRKRHLKHVTINMGHLTHPPCCRRGEPGRPVGWITPEGLPTAPDAGLGLESLDDAERDSCSCVARRAAPFDGDAMLDRRMDGQGDELGRAIAALSLRLRLSEPRTDVDSVHGGRVLVDARCLQSAAFGTRGIGRFARAALLALRAEVDDARIDLLVDRGLEELPVELAGSCRQVTRVPESAAASYASCSSRRR